MAQSKQRAKRKPRGVTMETVTVRLFEELGASEADPGGPIHGAEVRRDGDRLTSWSCHEYKGALFDVIDARCMALRALAKAWNIRIAIRRTP